MIEAFMLQKAVFSPINEKLKFHMAAIFTFLGHNEASSYNLVILYPFQGNSKAQ